MNVELLFGSRPLFEWGLLAKPASCCPQPPPNRFSHRPRAPPHPASLLLQQKNVGSDVLEGKVGRIYMPTQEVDNMALAKPKGVKRERRAAAAEAAEAKKRQKGAAPADEGGSD